MGIEMAFGIKLQIFFIGATRSRSLRDGSLSNKGHFATFVCSYWTPQRITHEYVIPVTSNYTYLINSACSPLIAIHNMSIATVTPCNTGM